MDVFLFDFFSCSLKTTTTTVPPAPNNCREFLDKRLQVRWIMKGDRVEITLSSKIGDDKYMAFGLSGDNKKAQMASNANSKNCIK